MYYTRTLLVSGPVEYIGRGWGGAGLGGKVDLWVCVVLPEVMTDKRTSDNLTRSIMLTDNLLICVPLSVVRFIDFLHMGTIELRCGVEMRKYLHRMPKAVHIYLNCLKVLTYINQSVSLLLC